jgi:hypothetical protein
MGARLQTTPQALWLFQPTPVQRVKTARPIFEKGIAMGDGPGTNDPEDFFAYTDATGNFYARVIGISWQGNGDAAGTADAITKKFSGATYYPLLTGFHNAHDNTEGIDADVPVLVALPNTFFTLSFKDGLLVGVTP